MLGRINAILDRRWLSNNGPVVQEFEKKVADVLAVVVHIHLMVVFVVVGVVVAHRRWVSG